MKKLLVSLALGLGLLMGGAATFAADAPAPAASAAAEAKPADTAAAQPLLRHLLLPHKPLLRLLLAKTIRLLLQPRASWLKRTASTSLPLPVLAKAVV